MTSLRTVTDDFILVPCPSQGQRYTKASSGEQPRQGPHWPLRTQQAKDGATTGNTSDDADHFHGNVLDANLCFNAHASSYTCHFPASAAHDPDACRPSTAILNDPRLPSNHGR